MNTSQVIKWLCILSFYKYLGSNISNWYDRNMGLI